ncbi:DUF935 domain-containing protein [Idiomarina xiamenensis]|uniref:F, portal protein n=1 Tax=Idiomarina xiamenensis 10-D-4 TaxID=740709 RepID=K2J978_9GAMM|nr:DUF935 family protein [Idiomarina xiamenensis]EKE79711.1 F, portal protein [Idiomarina xiamenensis 10-D-4]
MAKTKKPIKTELSKADHGRALASALIQVMIENPDNVLRTKGGGQFDVYKELLRDDQVRSTFQQRRTAVTQAEIDIVPGGKSAQDIAAAEYIKQVLDDIGFDQVTDKMLYANHYGYSVAELMPVMRDGLWYLDSIKVRDRGRFRFGVNNELLLLKGAQQHAMPREKFWVFSVGQEHDDNPYGEGLAHALYWPVFFKRNCIKFWLIHLEKFGMPTATAKLSPAAIKDPEQREMALDVLDAVQADSGVLIPEDFVVELLEASRSGTADYKALEEGMNRAISKIILSQTMTTDDGSSYSQAKVHGGVKADLIKSDADLICASFNTQVVDYLVSLNFENANPPRVWRKTEEKEDLNTVADRDKKIFEMGYEPTEEYIKSTYGDGWRKRDMSFGRLPMGNQIQPMGAEFGEVSPLTEKRIQHRRDQRDIVDAGEYLAQDADAAIGSLARKIIEFAQSAGNENEFRKRLDELAELDPLPDVVERIRNANVYARMRGYMKNGTR